MADFNLMDILLDQNDSLFNFGNCGEVVKPEKEVQNTEWLSDDFLDSILEANPANEFKLLDENIFSDDLFSTVSSTFGGSSPDSGISNDPASPEVTEPAEEIGIPENTAEFNGDYFLNDINDFETISTNNVENREEVQNAIFYNSNPITGTGENVIYISSDVCDENRLLISQKQQNRQKRICSTSKRNSTLKAVKSRGKNTDKNCIRQKKRISSGKWIGNQEKPSVTGKNQSGNNNNTYYNPMRMVIEDDESISDEDSIDDSFRKIRLSPEEKRLMVKEGVVLPTRHPLTKQEEKELKRIRRKIRNKISAQDSRRRKKEYVDGLEERVKCCSEENIQLLKSIKQLQSQNVILVNQVRKLQATLAKSIQQPTSTQSNSTYLMVLFLSLALVLAPNLRNSQINSDEGISLSDSDEITSLIGRSKNLLFPNGSSTIADEQVINEDANKMIVEELKKMDLTNLDFFSNFNELLSRAKAAIGGGQIMQNLALKEHDYFRPRKRSASGSLEDLAKAKIVKSGGIDSKFGLGLGSNTRVKTECCPIVIDLVD